MLLHLTAASRRAAVESLERRALFDASATLDSAGVLNVVGTWKDDSINVYPNPDDASKLEVRVNRSRWQFDRAAVTGIFARSYRGHDRINIFGGDGQPALPLRIYGDAGIDWAIVHVTAETRFFGGTGNDRLIVSGPGGRVFAYGEEGDDSLGGERRNDLLNGGDGDDTLIGGGGHDTLVGGSGNDGIGGDSVPQNSSGVPQGFDGDDLLEGNDGNDTLLGWNGNDTITGGAGNDLLGGGRGVEDANDGLDQLFGDAGEDDLDGGHGDDTLTGGADNDDLFGIDVAGILADADSIDAGANGNTAGES